MFFCFINWNRSCHSLLAYRVSVEKSADNVFGFPLYVTYLFSLVTFNDLPLSLIFVSLITMFWCIPPWVYPAWDCLCFSWTWLTVSFPMFRHFSAIISSNIFLGPFSLSAPSQTPIMQMLMHLMLSQRSLRLFLFILFSILFCSSDFHHSILQVIYPFFCLIYSSFDSFQCIIHLCLFS